MSRLMEAEYNRARHNMLRQKNFVSQINTSHLSPYLKKLRYSPLQRTQMSTWRHVPTLKPESKTSIVIGPKAFRTMTYIDFMNCVHYHESEVHLEQFAKRTEVIKEISKQMKISLNNEDFEQMKEWKSVVELPAYANQLAHADSLTERGEKSVKLRYNINKTNICYGDEIKAKKELLEAILLGTPGDEIVRRDVLGVAA